MASVQSYTMATGLEEFRELKEWLLLEKKADLEQYKEKIERLPLEKRKEEGVAWYPPAAPEARVHHR